MNIEKKISAFVLAIVLLVSTFSFKVNVHYCQQELKSISFIGTAISCHENAPQNSCSANAQKKCCSGANQQDTPKKKDDCCHNEDHTFLGQNPETLLSNTFVVATVDKDFSLLGIAPTLLPLPSPFHSKRRYKPPLYEPPKLFSNRLALHQTLLL